MEDERPKPQNFVITAALFEGGLAVAAALLGRVFGYPPLEYLHWTGEGVVWGLLATVPPLLAFYLCVNVRLKFLEETVRIVDDLVVPLFKGCGLTEVAIIAMLAGVGEEMLFRIVIQHAVAEWIGGLWGIWIGLAVATAVFGALHALTPVYALMAGAICVYLGTIWLATDNLLVPIIAHAVYDFVALVYLVRFRSKPE